MVELYCVLCNVPRKGIIQTISRTWSMFSLVRSGTVRSYISIRTLYSKLANKKIFANLIQMNADDCRAFLRLAV